MTDIDTIILGMWDRGHDTVGITKLLNGEKMMPRFHESDIHRLLIRARQKRRIINGVKA